MSEKIQQYLDQHLGEGQKVSQGRFSLSGERAIQKLAEYSVERPEQWVLKWVQAAVASGASKVSFIQTREGTQAKAFMSEPPSIAQFEAGLLRLEVCKSPFWREAVIGIRALLHCGTITLVCPDGQWSWDGQKVIPADPNLGRGDASVALHFSLGVSRSHKQAWLQWRSQEARELELRCRCCHVPLWLDSRQVNSLQARPASSHPPSSHSVFSPRLLAVGWVPWQSQTEATPLRASSVPEIDPLRSAQPFLHWPLFEGVPDRQLAFRIMISEAKRSSLVRDLLRWKTEERDTILSEPFRVGGSRFGVLCAALSSTEFFPFGGELVVQANHLRSDFSGLALEQSDEWWTLLRHAFLRFKGPLRRLSSEIKDYQPSPGRADLRSGISDVISGGATGALFGFLKGGPVGSVMIGSFGAYSAYRYSSLDEEKFLGALRRAATEATEVLDVLGREGLTAYSPGWYRDNL